MVAAAALAPIRRMRLPAATWNEVERSTFDVLKGIAPMWITGGWVRDKVLEATDVNPTAFAEFSKLRDNAGSPPGDIDVLLAGMSARSFQRQCNRNKELRALLLAPTFLVRASGARTVETVKLRLPGREIDVSSLGDGVVPATGSATGDQALMPEDLLRADCEHRDSTFNSLYYDLSAEEVLDPCGRGLDDLRDGAVRMPHPDGPAASVSDDPVRLLRCYRFSARYGFSLSTELMRDESEALCEASDPSKTTAGRLLNEFRKAMLLHNRPSRFLGHLGGPPAIRNHFFGLAGPALLDAWPAAVGRARRLEELVLEGLSRGRLRSRSVQWRGRRSGGPIPAFLTTDWRKTTLEENDWAELCLAALMWCCDEEAVRDVGMDLQLSQAMIDAVVALQKQSRQPLTNPQSAPPGVVLLSAAVRGLGADATDAFWERWPVPPAARTDALTDGGGLGGQ